ncbi:Sterol 3-beta-glucosyltransferase [Vanrija pseudolonga]|uniref:sterol 3beta-glucosyltransferase n=1 Tax=Vanrija pseudolonga TaxID=143232 RepID=A0AAF0YDL2_9TREE|nr:Sterol 3-beta-glucosyltransferase [Vanrija pseudolonga]
MTDSNRSTSTPPFATTSVDLSYQASEVIIDSAPEPSTYVEGARGITTALDSLSISAQGDNVTATPNIDKSVDESRGSRQSAIPRVSFDEMSPFMTEPEGNDSKSSQSGGPPAFPSPPRADQEVRRPPQRSSTLPGATKAPQLESSRPALGRSQSSNDTAVGTMGVGSIPIGTSAIVSAITALPWEASEEESSGEESDPQPPAHRLSKTVLFKPRAKKPAAPRLHSSLHTIKTMHGGVGEEEDDNNDKDHVTPVDTKSKSHHHFHHHLTFPFKDNVIARRARAPGHSELVAQGVETASIKSPDTEEPDRPPRRVESSSTITIGNVSGSGDGQGRVAEDALSVEEDPSDSQPLAKRLQDVFGLDDQEEVIAEMSCWLLRSVMLKGYMFLTRTRICFFANMPHEDTVVLKSGPLYKKHHRTKLSPKFWVVLRDNVLSWYDNSNDPYFPRGNVPLQYASSCEALDSTRFKLRTSERNYTFTADSEANATEWVRVIQKAIFKVQHEGESVKIVIPLEAVVDIERNPTLEFAETIEVKVVDPEDAMSMDSYFFASFPDNDFAYNVLHQALEERPISNLPPASSVQEAEEKEKTTQATTGGYGLPSIGTVLRPLLSRPGVSETRTPIVAPHQPTLPQSYTDDSLAYHGGGETEGSDDEEDDSEGVKGYPPKQAVIDDNVIAKFRRTFGVPESDQLLDHFTGYLYRLIPVRGRFYISENYFCFRSYQKIYKTTMIVPIRDMFGVKPQNAFRFAHHGLILIVKGHEEVFIEFSSSDRRSECMRLLEERIEAIRLDTDVIEDKTIEGEEVLAEDEGALKPAVSLENSSVISNSTSMSSAMFGSTASTFLDFKPEPMTIVCLTIGSRGDVQPYIALCKGLMAEGHTTIIATHGEYQKWVEGHGIGFRSVGGDPAELMAMCVEKGMFTVGFLKEGLQKFRGWLDDLLQSSWEACQSADLLIESPSAMAGIHVAEALQIPYYRAFTMPWTRTRAYPQAFAVPEQQRGGSYNYMTYVMFDQIFWHAISGQINRWRKHTLGLDATGLDKLEQTKVPFLYNFSPTVVPPPLDATEWIHTTGYWFLDHYDGAKQNNWTPPEDLVAFIEGAHAKGKKVVYIGFGSIVVTDPDEMTRCVVDAVVDSGVCAVLSKGWSDRGHKHQSAKAKAEIIEYPDVIYPVDSIDHSWLFPRIDAACHHGGAGTTGASLRAGIPTIIKPFFGDQYFWAERVESLGVGTSIRKLTKETLADALLQATTSEKEIARAKSVGERIRKESGVQRAIEALYRDLEYAKALIKPLPSSEPRRTISLPVRVRTSSTPKSGAQTPFSTDSTGGEHSTGHSRANSHGSIFGGLKRHTSNKHARAVSADREGNSDESWSVVSDTGVGDSQVSSPAQASKVLSEGSWAAESEEVPRAGLLGGLVGHLLPGKRTPDRSQAATPEPPRPVASGTAA